MRSLVSKKRIPKPLQILVINELDQIINLMFIESLDTGQVFPFYVLIPAFFDSAIFFDLQRGRTVKAGKISSLRLSMQKALHFANSVSTIWLRELLLKGFFIPVRLGKQENPEFQVINWVIDRIEQFRHFFRFPNPVLGNAWDEINRLSMDEETSKFEDTLISISPNICETLWLIGTLENLHRALIYIKKAVDGQRSIVLNNILDSIQEDLFKKELFHCPDSKHIEKWHKKNNFY